MFTVKWYEHVRQVLGSQEVREIVRNMPQVEVSDVVTSVLLCYLESLWNVCLKFIMGRQGSAGERRPVDLYYRITPDDTVSLLKLGSAALLGVKKRLKKIVTDGKPAKGLKKETL